ncbi:hypothetical protein [Trebonia sp.]|uniref:hypothetical protein n=1 Tax=Trebonia sp. TaxID=2767075 RepID=UPI002626E43B|nr:hypothetical protein [Trebonia sp.]
MSASGCAAGRSRTQPAHPLSALHEADGQRDAASRVIDWSEASQGDALYDLATLTLGHREHLGGVVAGYGTDVDLDEIRAWWSPRSLRAARWLIEHGFDHPRQAGSSTY